MKVNFKQDNLDGVVQLEGELTLDGPSAGIDFGGNSAS